MYSYDGEYDSHVPSLSDQEMVVQSELTFPVAFFPSLNTAVAVRLPGPSCPCMVCHPRRESDEKENAPGPALAFHAASYSSCGEHDEQYHVPGIVESQPAMAPGSSAAAKMKDRRSIARLGVPCSESDRYKP